jgi:hypothetical protein
VLKHKFGYTSRRVQRIRGGMMREWGDGRNREWGVEAQVRIYLAKGEAHQGRNDAGRSSRFFEIVFKK